MHQQIWHTSHHLTSRSTSAVASLGGAAAVEIPARHRTDGAGWEVPPISRLRARPEIKLRQLRYFLAAAECLHFSRAADTEFVTQSTLSHQIAELEKQIGQPLFDRSAKTVRLTQAGEVFRVYAQRIVSEVDAGCSALFDLDNLVGGSLRVGASQSFTQRHLGPALAEFLRQHPAVHLHVEELTAPQIEQRLCSGQLDLGIAFAPTTMNDLQVDALIDEEMVLVVGTAHPLVGRRSLRMAELEGIPLALLNGEHLSRRHLDACFRDAGLAPRVVCESNNLGLMLDLVQSSGVAAIVPSCMVEPEMRLCSVNIIDPTPRRTVALLRSRSHHESAAARALAAIFHSRFMKPTPHPLSMIN
ncbi:MAG: hypothetical protein RJA63_3008 [Pseudomonadota bacterium]|jgi:LysR family cyn operon transcriptional activator